MVREEQVVLSFDVDLEDSIESINSLTKANKELRTERNKLDLDSKEGQKRLTEINATLDKNTGKIKDNVSALEKQKINIGNYKSALDGVVPGLGGFAQGLEKGTAGFKAMTMQALRFIATPIGAVLAAIVAVFSLLKAAVSGNNQVMDKFENITNAVGAIINVVVNRVGKLGEALIALSQGNFSEAMDLAGKAVSGLREELEAATGAAQLYLDVSRQIEDEQRSIRIETAKQENEIKRLVVAAKNRNLTLDEQEGLLRRALKLEQDLVSARELVANKDLQNTTKKLALEQSLRQSEDETFQQFTDRLLTEGILTDDRADAIIEKIEALEQARGSSLAFQEKVENSLATIQEKRALALEKQNKALEEQQALNRADRRSDTSEEVDPGADPLIDAFKTRIDTIETLDKRFQRDTIKRDKETKDQQAKNEKDLTALKDAQYQARLQALSDSSQNAAIVFGEESALYKTLASAQTLIGTFEGAQKSYNALAAIPIVGPALGAAAAGLAVAAGLARVAAINGVEFAEGGWTGPGHKMQAVGVVHADEYVVPKRIVNNPMARSSIANLESMRLKPYADGGLVSNSIAQPVNQQMDIANILKNMPAPVVSVKEINTLQKRVQVKQNLSKR